MRSFTQIEQIGRFFWGGVNNPIIIFNFNSAPLRMIRCTALRLAADSTRS